METGVIIMKGMILAMALAAGIQSGVMADPTHLDIMVPDLKDTDLRGPVKSVELKLWRNVSGEFTTEKREFDRTGNLLKITEHDEGGKLVDTTTFLYDENGCYERRLYCNNEQSYSNEWKVVLNPETRQIALKEIGGDRVGIETYSDAGYLLQYRLLNGEHQPLVTNEYKRDENNRLNIYTRIESRKPVYTYYFKWADNGFIDMEAQTYHEEKDKRRHTYEYLVTDDHGNWTQRIMVRYDIGGKKPVKVYEHTVQRQIEYYGDEIEPDQGADTPTVEGKAEEEGDD